MKKTKFVNKGLDLRKLLPRGYAKDLARVFNVSINTVYAVAEGHSVTQTDIRLALNEMAMKEIAKRKKIKDLEDLLKQYVL